MITEATRVEREHTKQELVRLLKSPLLQALLVWLIVEYAQTYHRFGSITGTALEGASAVKLGAPAIADLMDSTVKPVVEAVAPLISLAALIPK